MSDEQEPVARLAPRPSDRRETWREAWRLSGPATVLLLLHAGYRVVDQYWVKDLGPSAQAALGVTSFMLILNFAFISVVSTGTLARVARFTGAGDRPGLERTVATSYGFGLLWFGTIGLVGYLTTPFWVWLCGAQGETAVLAGEYLRTIYLCLPLIALKPVTDSIFIGMGNTFLPMLLSGLSLAINSLLNPVLIYGLGGAPEMGVAGAALATGIARGTSSLLGALLIWRMHRLGPRRRSALDGVEVKRITRVGAPMGLSTAGYALTFLAVLKTTIERFYVEHGPDVQAGFGIAFNGIEALSYCGLMGPAIAVSGMVGRRLGAGDPEGARDAVRACMVLSCCFAFLTTLAFLLAPRWLASFYSDEVRVLDQAVLYLWIVGWSQIVTAAQSVLEQALAGSGHTLVMSITTMAGNVIRIPLAFALAHPLGYGPAGAWWALNLSNFLKLGAIVAVFRAGRWHRGPATETPTRADVEAA